MALFARLGISERCWGIVLVVVLVLVLGVVMMAKRRSVTLVCL